MQKGLKELQVLKVRCSDTVTPNSGATAFSILGGGLDVVEGRGVEVDNG